MSYKHPLFHCWWLIWRDYCHLPDKSSHKAEKKRRRRSGPLTMPTWLACQLLMYSSCLLSVSQPSGIKFTTIFVGFHSSWEFVHPGPSASWKVCKYSSTMENLGEDSSCDFLTFWHVLLQSYRFNTLLEEIYIYMVTQGFSYQVTCNLCLLLVQQWCFRVCVRPLVSSCLCWCTGNCHEDLCLFSMRSINGLYGCNRYVKMDP